jgi:hypothetical protein
MFATASRGWGGGVCVGVMATPRAVTTTTHLQCIATMASKVLFLMYLVREYASLPYSQCRGDFHCLLSTNYSQHIAEALDGRCPVSFVLSWLVFALIVALLVCALPLARARWALCARACRRRDTSRTAGATYAHFCVRPHLWRAVVCLYPCTCTCDRVCDLC